MIFSCLSAWRNQNCSTKTCKNLMFFGIFLAYFRWTILIPSRWETEKSFWCQNIIRNVFRNINLSLGYNFVTFVHVLGSIWQYIAKKCEKRPKYPIWLTFWRGFSEDSRYQNILRSQKSIFRDKSQKACTF